MHEARTTRPNEVKIATWLAALACGMLFVAEPPKYHDPISVSWPSSVNMAALTPTFETSERKAPKYE